MIARLAVGYPGWARGEGGFNLAVLVGIVVGLVAIRHATGRRPTLAGWGLALAAGPAWALLTERYGLALPVLAGAVLAGALLPARRRGRRAQSH